MRTVNESADSFCLDCRSTHTQPPRLAQGRSPRCPEHQKQRTRHLAQGRQARQRARKNPRATAPDPRQWAAQYTPQPLASVHTRAVLLHATDLEELGAVVADLRAAMDTGNNAYRRDDPTATRHALRDLLDRAYEASNVLEQIPGIRPSRP